MSGWRGAGRVEIVAVRVVGLRGGGRWREFGRLVGFG